MQYDINMSCKTNDGTKLGSVYLQHAPIDADKIVTIRASILRDGWVGRPVLLSECGDHYRAFTGVHRLCAAQGIDGVIEAVYLPEDLDSGAWDAINAANDEYELLTALKNIDCDGLAAAIAVMEAEIAANDSQ